MVSSSRFLNVNALHSTPPRGWSRILDKGVNFYRYAGRNLYEEGVIEFLDACGFFPENASNHRDGSPNARISV